VKLHVGAFDRVLPGWVNTDITPHLYIARVPGLAFLLAGFGVLDEARAAQHRSGVFRQLRKLDVRQRFPFADGSVDAVYISHMLSNVTRDVAEHCLAECHRVLKPGGILRVATLDLDAAVRGYDPEHPDVLMDLLFDLDTSKRAKNRHWWHYNECSLGERLRRAGFREWRRCEYQKGRCPDVEWIDSRPGSLFLEGVK
jgi:SAM-dependent methyltransferase